MIKKTLSTGRKVEIKKMSRDDIVHCEDIIEIHIGKHSNSIQKVAKARTEWIRKGLAGGDFEFKINGSVPDDVFTEMRTSEQEELGLLIKESQYLGKPKPSPLD